MERAKERGEHLDRPAGVPQGPRRRKLWLFLLVLSLLLAAALRHWLWRELNEEKLGIAIVIPALNEEEGLPKTLASVKGQSVQPQDIVVVDAGSQDRTVEVAALGGARVVRSGRGRAVQMNAGARGSTSEVLLFLHADTELPPTALEAVQRALSDERVAGGCFQLRFDVQSQHWALQLGSWGTRQWIFRGPHWVFGDRAIFVRRRVFEALGGYNEWPLMEDVDFAIRVGKTGPNAFAFIPMDVTTSARRLLEVGPARQEFLNLCILGLWHLGCSPEKLKEWYRDRAPQILGIKKKT